MDDLERSLRAQMGDSDFEAAYRSAFGRLRADRYGDYPLHEVTLRYVQSILQFQETGDVFFNPFGAPGVSTPEPDSVRIIQGSSRPSPSNSSGSGNSSSSSSGGCYIATAVYGSYNCPQVWTLRRYRDFSLAKTWYGRLFIRVYYIVSPILVKWLGKTRWFKRLWLSRLNKFVQRLNNAGVSDAPYKD